MSRVRFGAGHPPTLHFRLRGLLLVNSVLASRSVAEWMRCPIAPSRAMNHPLQRALRWPSESHGSGLGTGSARRSCGQGSVRARIRPDRREWSLV